jgi:hypothetical protein
VPRSERARVTQCSEEHCASVPRSERARVTQCSEEHCAALITSLPAIIAHDMRMVMRSLLAAGALDSQLWSLSFLKNVRERSLPYRRRNRSTKEYIQRPPPSLSALFHCRRSAGRQAVYSPVRPGQSEPPIWWHRACSTQAHTTTCHTRTRPHTHKHIHTHTHTHTHTHIHHTHTTHTHTHNTVSWAMIPGLDGVRLGRARTHPTALPPCTCERGIFFGRVTHAVVPTSPQEIAGGAGHDARGDGGERRRQPRAAELLPWQTARLPSGRRASPTARQACIRFVCLLAAQSAGCTASRDRVVRTPLNLHEHIGKYENRKKTQ